jgi:hypothetical protein
LHRIGPVSEFGLGIGLLPSEFGLGTGSRPRNRISPLNAGAQKPAKSWSAAGLPCVAPSITRCHIHHKVYEGSACRHGFPAFCPGSAVSRPRAGPFHPQGAP